MKAKKSKDQIIKELREENKIFKVKLKHMENDYQVTQEEYENTTRRYLEMLSNLEKVVEERTERVREVRKRLGQQRLELQIMLDAVPAMVFYKGKDLRYIRTNKMFCEMAQMSIEDIVGKTDAQLFSGRKHFNTRDDKKALKTGDPVLKRIEKITIGDTARTIQIDRIPYRDEHNKIIGIIGFALDITEQ